MPTPTQPQRILLVASKLGYQTRAFDEAASRMGVELVYATDRCGAMNDPWGDGAVPLKFHNPELSLERLGKAGLHVSGVVAVGDKPSHIAALAAAHLGIPFSAPDAVAAAGNKHEARRRFAAAGLPVPRFFRVSLSSPPRDAARHAPYPCVLKPLGLSASRGVVRANTETEFLAAFERIRVLLESPDIRRTAEEVNRYIQVEEFITGKEYALEGMLTRGELQVHAIFDKPDELSGPFFEETIYVTPPRLSARAQHEIITATRRACEALGLSHGPIHAEMRVNEDGVWMLEVAARPIGGLCARALRFTGGVSLEELILIHALGEDVSCLRREQQASGVMMIPIPKNGIYRGVTGVEDAGAVPGIWHVEITAKEGQRLLKLPEGATYLGFLFARGDDSAGVEAALRRSHDCLEFDISTDLPVFGPAAGALVT